MPKEGTYKMTEAVVLNILSGFEEHLPLRHCASLGGITEDTLTRWRKEHPDFNAKCLEAEQRGVAKLLTKINQNEDWRAQAFILERRYPSDFGKQLNVTGNLDIVINAVSAPQPEGDLPGETSEGSDSEG